jgi:adenylate cyclase
VRAELLVRRGADPARIEASYHEAIDLAHRQAARSLELRAVSSWALWRRGGGGFAEARHRLGEICAVFPPGLDTRDLREARAVLPADERPGGPQ